MRGPMRCSCGCSGGRDGADVPSVLYVVESGTRRRGLPVHRAGHEQPGAEKGPANNDRRHQLVALGTQTLPWGFQVAAYFAARSALPFTITTGRDNNGDTNINDRPDVVNPNGDPLNRSEPTTSPSADTREVSVEVPHAGRTSHSWTFDCRTFVRFGTRGSKASSKPSTPRTARTSARRSAIFLPHRSDYRRRFRAPRGRRSSASDLISDLVRALMPRFGGPRRACSVSSRRRSLIASDRPGSPFHVEDEIAASVFPRRRRVATEGGHDAGR